MSEMLFIGLFVICLGASAAALMLVYQMTRDYQADFLNYYFYYLMAYFVFGLYGLWGQVVVRYLLEQLESKSTVIQAMVGVLPLFGVPFLLVTWLMLLKMAFDLIGENISSLQTLIYFLVITVILGLTGWLLTDLIDPIRLELYLYLSLEMLFYVIFVVLTQHAIKKINNPGKQRIYSYFSFLVLLGLVLRMALLPLLSWHPIILGGVLLLYFVGNLFPVWFLYSKADQLFPSYTADLTDTNRFEQFNKQHGISKREAEIIQLICQGKSNQEIADALFIGLQTVKDHNHRIYTKIGIRSRMQLINLVK